MAILAAAPAAAHEAAERGIEEKRALAVSQAAVGGALGDHSLVDISGRTIRLGALRGKPLIVAMIYTSCADICPLTLQTLRRAARVAREALGKDGFNVAIVGFDTPNDTPSRLHAYARSQGLADEGWLFLAADHATIDRLAADLGFLYAASPKGFDHLTQTTVIDSGGRVFRQVYGETFAVPSLVEPLKDLILGRQVNYTSFEGLAAKIKLICTVYDAASGRYRFSFAIFMSVIVGAISLGSVGLFLARAWLQRRAIARSGAGASS